MDGQWYIEAMRFFFWSIIFMFLVIQGILYVSGTYGEPFLKSSALVRSAVVVKSEVSPRETPDRFSFSEAWGQDKKRTYLFLITNPAILRPDGGITHVGILSIEEKRVQKFEVIDQETLDSSLDYRISPPRLLRPLASTLAFDHLTWFQDKTVRNHLATVLSANTFKEEPQFVVTLTRQEFDRIILPLGESQNRPITFEEFTMLQELVTTRSKEASRFNVLSYDMTFPKRERIIQETQVLEERYLPGEIKETRIMVTQVSPEEFLNFVRVYIPEGARVIKTKGALFTPTFPRNAPSALIDPMIASLEESLSYNSLTHMYTYQEGAHRVVGGFIKIGRTPRTFSISIAEDYALPSLP